MLEKTIKTVLTRKINDWLHTIDDPVVVKTIKDNIVVTGGCFTSMIQNEIPKDYDVYLSTKEACIAVSKYYINQFNKEHGIIHNHIGVDTKAFVLTSDMFEIIDEECHILDSELALLLDPPEGDEPTLKGTRTIYPCNFEDEKVSDKNYQGLTRMITNTTEDRIKIFISSDGVAEQLKSNNIEDIPMGSDPVDIISEADDIPAEKLDGEKKSKYRPVFLSTNAITLSDGIQIVVRFYGDPETIHSTYDFVHTKAYWTSWDKDVIIPKEVYEAVVNKTLIYTGSKYPVCSVIRMRKFINRGWRINAGQILRMCMQISELDLTDIDVLEDQLVGVDSLYFTALINQFRSKIEKNKDWVFDSGYVATIIDKIF